MKNLIVMFLLGLSIGMLMMINQVCRQKDSTIRLLMKNNIESPELAEVPKNLPLIRIK